MKASFAIAFKKTVLPIYMLFVYPVVRILLKYNILDSVETITKIKKENLSISRYGDGEYEILRKKGTGFQKANDELAKRLEYVLHNPISNHLVCIPYTIVSLDDYRPSSRKVWKSFLCRNYPVILKNTDKNYLYGNSLCTRFYMPMADKSKARQIATLLKSIWEEKKICIIEGEGTRLGVGNDLLRRCLDVKRIICPSKNAFSKYDTIRYEVNKLITKDVVVLIALGMTATILAYDLTIDGYQAIDIGHIDVEYEWMIMGASEKCDLPGKAVNELGNNVVEQIIDHTYENQIIKRIYG